jgi:hypothetical protein
MGMVDLSSAKAWAKFRIQTATATIGCRHRLFSLSGPRQLPWRQLIEFTCCLLPRPAARLLSWLNRRESLPSIEEQTGGLAGNGGLSAVPLCPHGN